MKFYKATKSTVNGEVIYGNLPANFVIGLENSTEAFFALEDEVSLPSGTTGVTVLTELDYKAGVDSIQSAHQLQRESEFNNALTALKEREVERSQLNVHVTELREQSKTAKQKYAALDLAVATLDQVKAAKIAALKEDCSQAIFNGFISSTGHSFGFNLLDQQNFDQQYLLVVSGDNAGATISWKAKSGVVSLTEAQFKTVIGEAKNHKVAEQQKFWNAESKVIAALTNTEVDAVIY